MEGKKDGRGIQLYGKAGVVPSLDESPHDHPSHASCDGHEFHAPSSRLLRKNILQPGVQSQWK